MSENIHSTPSEVSISRSPSESACGTGRVAAIAGRRGLGAGIRNVFALLVLVGFAFTSAGIAAAEGASRLDLNRATAAELEALPGIGAVKAAAILAVREDRGGFSRIEELESVRGIGPALASKLRPLVRITPKKAAGGSPGNATRTAKK